MLYRQRVVGGKLRSVEEEEQSAGKYRQILIGGKLRSVLPDEDKNLEPADRPFDEQIEQIPTPIHPFDEQIEQQVLPTSTVNKGSSRREVEHFDDLFIEDDDIFSGINDSIGLTSDDANHAQYDHGVNDDSHDRYDVHPRKHKYEEAFDDSASTITKDECDFWNAWVVPDWLRRKVASAEYDKMEKSGMATSYDCDNKEADSFTTATTTSDKSGSSGGSSRTNYMGTSVPLLVLTILRDELIEACGNMDSVHGTRNTKLKTYMITKHQQRENVGLTFAINKVDGAVYVCEIRKGSKFLTTGLQVGSRVVSINGVPVPKKPKELVKVLKRARREIVLIAETPEAKVKSFLKGVCHHDDFTVQTERW
ncbi:MAG: hypothetical protein SGBAC_006727 [Bacillariaceae sp.]